MEAPGERKHQPEETLPTLTFEELKAAVIREQVIEAGVRSGHLEPYRTPYSREDDGSLTIHVADKGGRIHISPAEVHGPGAPMVRLVCTGEFGRRQMWAATVGIVWDASRTDWRPYDPTSTRDVAGELWDVIELRTKMDGWTLPSR